VAEIAAERLDASQAVGEIAGDISITGISERFRCLWNLFDDSSAANAAGAAELTAQHG
jgi:hypothetical protein